MPSHFISEKNGGETTKKRLTTLLALALVLALLVLTGCSSAASGDNAAAETATSTGEMMFDSSQSNTSSGADSGELGFATEESESQSSNASASLPGNTKFIYTADINLESTQFDAVVADLETLVELAGGYFERSSLDNYGTYRTGFYTVRVPADQFESFCSRVGTLSLCQVNGISRNAEDISEVYYDTESRLVTQQTKLERLQTLLAGAETMEDIITIETAISETELAIEELTGTLRRYDSLSDYATIYINLSEVYELSELEEPAIGFGARLTAALRSGARGFVNGLQDFLVAIAGSWAGILTFLVIVGAGVGIFFGVRRRRRKRERKAEPPKSDEAE